MKLFLLKMATLAIVMGAAVISSGVTGVDPVWLLLGLFLWKDLSETLGKED